MTHSTFIFDKKGSCYENDVYYEIAMYYSCYLVHTAHVFDLEILPSSLTAL